MTCINMPSLAISRQIQLREKGIRFKIWVRCLCPCMFKHIIMCLSRTFQSLGLYRNESILNFKAFCIDIVQLPLGALLEVE